VSSKLNELKNSNKELRDEHDKLEKRHNKLATRYNLIKDEYTTLKINHDSLIVANELSSHEPHDATNHVVKIDIATSCDDLIVESIEQGSSSKGKKVVESDNYDDYAKLKSEKEKLKKDLEKATTINTVVIENLNNDELTLENEKLKEENKRLKYKMSCIKQTTNESLIEENKKLMLEKEHLKVGLSKFEKGKSLQSDLLMNTVIKMDKSKIGYLANQEKKAKAQEQQQHKSKHKPKRCFDVDKKVTLHMSVKLLHHNPCPSMLDPLLSMLTTC
jgi:hypothetical protein